MDINKSDEADPHVGSDTGDLLVTAPVIEAFLISLGMPEETDAYYLKRTGWPIGSTSPGGGGKLIASKRRLSRHTQKLATPAS
jgi:hypothetical protein